MKGWDKKLIKYKKMSKKKSKQQSNPTSEKVLNDNTQKIT